jgi:UDP-N-acetylglucosamine 2-epimerase (non-hydrolysing)
MGGVRIMNGTVAVVVGTRPEGVKLAPVIQELARRPGVRPLVISTGQHREMLAQTLAVFDVKPDVDLSVMSPGQTLHDVTTRTLERMRPILDREKPDWVVVQGDTTTAFAAALAAFYEKLPVAHVEAGLRSGQRYSPFPEELNRRMVDQLSHVLFAPTRQARDLLLGEGFSPDIVHVTGNTVVDALLAAQDVLSRTPITIEGLDEAKLEGRRVVLVTAHRRESFGASFESMCRALLRIVEAEPDVLLIYPVHLNPNVDGPVRRLLGHHPRIALLKPVGYLQFVWLMQKSYLVLTDSGGVQEEAPTFHKPILVMREVTERPEGIEAGVALLVGTQEENIVRETTRLLREPRDYEQMARGVNPYGDGTAAQRIVDVLAGPRVSAPRSARSRAPSEVFAP